MIGTHACSKALLRPRQARLHRPGGNTENRCHLGCAQLVQHTQGENLLVAATKPVKRRPDHSGPFDRAELFGHGIRMIRFGQRLRDPRQESPIAPARTILVSCEVVRGDQQPRKHRTLDDANNSLAPPRLDKDQRNQIFRVGSQRSSGLRSVSASLSHPENVSGQFISDLEVGSTTTFKPIRIVPAGVEPSNGITRALESTAPTLNGRWLEQPCTQVWDGSAGTMSRHASPAVDRVR